MRILREGSSDPDLSVCIPTYDYNSGRAAKAVECVREHTSHLAYETVVADCEGELLGWTVPQNCAVSVATGRYLALLNDDVTVTAGWVDPLLDALDRGAWCATPDATHTDGPQVFHPWCMLWSRAGWEQVGGLDERFVLWGSDLDMARRLVDADHPPVKVKLPVPVRHQLNATSNEHLDLGPICVEDLTRFQQKWGVPAEQEKHRLAALVF